MQRWVGTFGDQVDYPISLIAGHVSCRIVMTVRHWLAARLQDKLPNQRQAKFVPRVECPQNAAQRRETIVAVFPSTILYDSEEEVTDLVTQGSAVTTEKVTQSQNPEKDNLRRKSTRERKPSARAIDSEQLQLLCTGSKFRTFGTKICCQSSIARQPHDRHCQGALMRGNILSRDFQGMKDL